KPKPAGCWSPSAARTSNWWKPDAPTSLHHFDFADGRGRGRRHRRATGTVVAPAAHRGFPGHGPAAETAPATAQRLFHERPQFAIAATRHDCAQPAAANHQRRGLAL